MRYTGTQPLLSANDIWYCEKTKIQYPCNSARACYLMFNKKKKRNNRLLMRYFFDVIIQVLVCSFTFVTSKSSKNTRDSDKI